MLRSILPRCLRFRAAPFAVALAVPSTSSSLSFLPYLCGFAGLRGSTSRFSTSRSRLRRKKRAKVRAAKKTRKAKKAREKAAALYKKPKEEKAASPTKTMVANMRNFTRNELAELETSEKNNEERKALDAESMIPPDLAPEYAEEFLQIQKDAVKMLSSVLREADQKLHPVDSKARYRNLPLDIDHFFAELGLPEELKSYNKAIHACAVRGDIEKGLQAFEYMRKHTNFEPDVYTYNSLILLHKANPGRVGVDQALALYEEMVSNAIVPTVHTFGAIIGVCAKANDETKVWRFLKEMDERGIKRTNHITTSVITMLLRMHKLDKIWDEYYYMIYKGAIPDDATYALMFRVCATTKEIERGLALLNDMRMDGMEPSARAFNTAIYMCAQRPEFYVEGFSLFQEMVDKGYMPDEYTLSSLLLCCARAGDVANSIRLCRQFIHTYKIKLGLSHYERLFEAIAQSMMKPNVNLYEESQDMKLEFIGEKSPTARRELAKKADLNAPETRKERVKLAESVMQDMLDQGLTPNNRVINQFFRVYAAAAGPAPPPGPDKRKRIEEAGGEKVKDMPLSKLYFDKLILDPNRIQELQKAEELFETIHKQYGLKRDHHTYYFMLKMYADRRGEEERFRAFLERMRKDDVPLEVPQYNIILERYERMEHYEAFLDTVHEMHVNKKKVNDYWRQFGEKIIEEVIQARERKKVQKAGEELQKQPLLKWKP